MGDCITVLDPRTPGVRPPPPDVDTGCGEGLRKTLAEALDAQQAYWAWREWQRAQIGPVCPDLGPGCRAAFDPELTVRLRKCGPEFYKLCDFDDLIRICPFDPAWDAFEWKQKLVSERLEVLEVQVKELQAKLPTHK